jgi:hypothetical protein
MKLRPTLRSATFSPAAVRQSKAASTHFELHTRVQSFKDGTRDNVTELPHEKSIKEK